MFFVIWYVCTKCIEVRNFARNPIFWFTTRNQKSRLCLCRVSKKIWPFSFFDLHRCPNPSFIKSIYVLRIFYWSILVLLTTQHFHNISYVGCFLKKVQKFQKISFFYNFNYISLGWINSDWTWFWTLFNNDDCMTSCIVKKTKPSNSLLPLE